MARLERVDGWYVISELIRAGRHPLHPAIVHFPVAFWTIGVGADLAGYASRHAAWWQFGALCIGVGAVTGLAAILAGILEFARLPRQHPAQDAAVQHMMWALTAWSLFVLHLVMRGGFSAERPPLVAMAISVGAAGALAVAGWLGGRLVYYFGVGVSVPPQGQTAARDGGKRSPGPGQEKPPPGGGGSNGR